MNCLHERTIQEVVMSEGSIRLRNLGALPTDRRSFIVGSDARVIMGDDEGALLRFWREKPGEAEPKDLSSRPRGTQPCDCASAKPSASPVREAHAEFAAALAAHPSAGNPARC